MSREILFRGKITDTGRWYEGQYIHLHKTTYCFKEDYDRNPDNDIHQIVFEKMTDWGLPNRHLRADVLPETVGQYTGLTDKNGKKIFEGDIIQKVYSECRGVCYVVKMSTERCGWYPFACDDGCGCCSCELEEPKRCEVIGNIHDNPELLEGVVQE